MDAETSNSWMQQSLQAHSRQQEVELYALQIVQAINEHFSETSIPDIISLKSTNSIYKYLYIMKKHPIVGYFWTFIFILGVKL